MLKSNIKKISVFLTVLTAVFAAGLFSGCNSPYSNSYEEHTQLLKSLKFTVTYDANGGSGKTESSEGTLGEEVSLRESSFSAPSSILKFSCWNTKADGSGKNYEAGETIVMDSDNVTLYAVWIYYINFQVKYNANGGSGITSYSEGLTGTTVKIKESGFTPVNSNYRFVCWNTAADGTGISYSPDADFVIGSSDTVLYAIWEKYKSTITYNANGGSGTTLYSEELTGTTVKIKESGFTYADTNYRFVCWNTAADGTGTSYSPDADFIVGTDDIVLYAIWKKYKSTITYNANGGSGTTYSDTAEIGSEITIMANSFTAPANKAFKIWTTKSDGDGTKYTPGDKYLLTDEDITLYANWIAVSITFDKNTLVFNGASDSPVSLTATVSGLNEEDIVWSSKNSEVATANNGLITPVNSGVTVVQATVGSCVSSAIVIVMRESADTTYDLGSVAVDSYITGRTYHTDAANQVAYALANNGLDFIGRLKSTDTWKKTTYGNNAWKWMIGSSTVNLDSEGNGTSGNLALSVRPVLAYDSSTGISYVVIFQILTNTGSETLTGVKFGSHADIQLAANDSANVDVTEYGAMMYDTASKLAFKVYAKSGDDCTPVDTLWFGVYSNRTSNIYGTSTTTNLSGTDSGMAYSWQNLTLEPGETLIRSIRMTLVEYTAE